MTYFKFASKLKRVQRKLFGGRRGHHVILSGEIERMLRLEIINPVIVETGCIRSLTEGTESTLTIASMVKDKGTFYTFELEPRHIAICKELCAGYNQYINYIEGDSVSNLHSMVNDQTISTIDFAFLDSVNDGNHIWKEFETIEHLFHKGSTLVVDDVLWAKKGEIIRPYLEQSGDWSTKIYNVESGIMVAKRL